MHLHRTLPRRALCAALAAAPLFALARAGAPPADTLRLYESVPAETSLGNPGWPRTDAVWLERFAAAERAIDLAHFYASDRPGSRLEAVVEALEAAADRGVAVRFLADAGFHETYPETLERLAAREGIELRLLDLKAVNGGVLHAKLAVVDGRHVCVGSANFDWRALSHIQELGVEVSSPAVAGAFRAVFEHDWALAAGESPPTELVLDSALPAPVAVGEDTVWVTPVFSPRDLLPEGVAWDLPRLVAAIDGAERRVRVQLLTYGTTDREGRYFDDLEAALRRAAARGVEVELLCANWAQRRWTIEGLQSLQALPRVTVKLVTVPEASEGFIPYARVVHAKYLVVDGRTSWIGTSNWSRDYFHASRNAGLLIEGAAVGAALDGFFERNWESPYAAVVDPCKQYEAPRVGE